MGQTTVQGFDRSNAKTVHQAVQDAMQRIAADYGLEADVGGLRFDDTQARCRVSFTCTEVRDGAGNVRDHKADDFRSKAPLVGVSESAYGQTITLRGREYVASRINLRATKMPVELTASDGGRGIKMAVEDFNRALQAEQ